VVRHSGHRVELAGKDERRTADAVKIAEPDKGAPLRAEEVEEDLPSEDLPRYGIGIAWGGVVERETGRQKRLEGLPVRFVTEALVDQPRLAPPRRSNMGNTRSRRNLAKVLERTSLAGKSG
jgi:hypothetical protein